MLLLARPRIFCEKTTKRVSKFASKEAIRPSFSSRDLSDPDSKHKSTSKSLPRFLELQKMRAAMMHPGKLYASFCVEKDDARLVKLNFSYSISPTESTYREIALLRKSDGLLSDTFLQILKKVNALRPKSARRKTKKFQNLDEVVRQQVEEVLFDELKVESFDGYFFDAKTTSNSDAFLNSGKSFYLNGRKYDIQKDAPYFDRFKLDIRLFIGCPAFPTIKRKNGRNEQCRIDWYVEKEKDIVCPNEFLNVERILHEDGEFEFKFEKFVYRGSHPYFVPQMEDIGKRVLIVGTPKNEDVEGIPTWNISRSKIEAFPDEPMIWDERHKLCAQKTEKNELRIVSYNVLADLYLDLEKIPQEKLFFSYCPAEYQQYDYRYPLLLRELTGYNADLMCLQEADVRFDARFLSPYFRSIGFEVLYSKKAREVNEGAATVYNKEKLIHLENYDIVLSSLLDSEDSLKKLASQDEESFKILESRPAVLQVNIFRPTTGGGLLLCVCNTHLHFHPKHNHIRLYQIILVMKHLDDVLRMTSKKHPNSQLGIIFCGDLNSTPDSSVYEALTRGKVEENDKDWFEEDSEKKSPEKGLNVETSFMMKSTCPALYTNYVGEHNFFGCLDYIFLGRMNSVASDFCKLLRRYPMPDHDLVKKYYAIPSKIAPSDHLALICDIQLNLKE
uniref:Endonuclease/exonuclease/phosphatase domain-containing protein n=1 Tax=Romanomermis culicivorax TaxID=13658 RepID=A0A915I320_ROMCU